MHAGGTDVLSGETHLVGVVHVLPSSLPELGVRMHSMIPLSVLGVSTCCWEGWVTVASRLPIVELHSGVLMHASREEEHSVYLTTHNA